MPTSQLTLPPQPASVSAARRFVVDVLLDLDAEAACDDAATLVSELATNAVLHAKTAFTVEIDLDGGAVRIGVLDHSVSVPRVRDYGTDATTGRGMRLVSSIATRWGVVPAQGGKVVWFELPTQGSHEGHGWDEADDEGDIDALLAAFADQEPEDEPQGTPNVLGWAA